MEKHLLLADAARVARTIAAEVDEAQLTAATPCAGWDVHALIRHLLQWGPALEGAARKELVPPGEAAEDWSKALPDQLDRLAEAWSAPAAWSGVTRMGGPMELPADLVGGMVLGEFVLHGWDLARAIGGRPEWDDEVLRLLYAEVARSADQGRAMGVYAAEVPVPPSAGLLDRALALSGRDPAWQKHPGEAAR
jgi:uncharacterized protein (TIGR03086 family)